MVKQDEKVPSVGESVTEVTIGSFLVSSGALVEEDTAISLTTKPFPAKVRIVQIGAVKKSALDSVSVEDIPHKGH